MQLEKVKILAQQLMLQWGLVEWKFEFTKLRPNALGTCYYKEKKIVLNEEFVLLNDITPIEDVIKHEIAHALCEPKDKHGPKWKQMCLKVGAIPNTCNTFEIVQKEERWKGVCPNGHIFYKKIHRTKKWQSCSKCAKKFNYDYILIWEDTKK